MIVTTSIAMIDLAGTPRLLLAPADSGRKPSTASGTRFRGPAKHMARPIPNRATTDPKDMIARAPLPRTIPTLSATELSENARCSPPIDPIMEANSRK
ncbi:hypothetical protein D3C76_1609040 [compost metagenome]